jgi:hypothetical protein
MSDIATHGRRHGGAGAVPSRHTTRDRGGIRMDAVERHIEARTIGGARAAALAGMAAPAVFAAGVTLATYLARGFLDRHGWTVTDHGGVPWPSGTALAEHGWIQSANFAVTGLLLLACVGALRRERGRQRSARVASALLGGVALAVTLLAFNTDLAAFGDGGSPETWHGWTHGIAFVALVLTSFAAFPAAALAFRGDPRWPGFAAFSAAVAVGVPAALFALGDVGFYVYLALVLSWFEAAAIRLWRLHPA